MNSENAHPNDDSLDDEVSDNAKPSGKSIARRIWEYKLLWDCVVGLSWYNWILVLSPLRSDTARITIYRVSLGRDWWLGWTDLYSLCADCSPLTYINIIGFVFILISSRRWLRCLLRRGSVIPKRT
jgi:hypothetical protein